MIKIFKILKSQMLSFVGSLISAGAFIYSKYVPTNIAVSTSQSVFSDGVVPVVKYISLSIIALSFLAFFVVFGIINYNHVKKK